MMRRREFLKPLGVSMAATAVGLDRLFSRQLFSEKGQTAGSPFFEKTSVFLPDQGFGVRLPGLLVTSGGPVLAVCQRRKGAMIDYGHDTDILVQRSVDDGRTWGQQKPLFSEKGTFCLTGPIVEDRVTKTVFVAFWKLPTTAPHDLKYFPTYAKTDGRFWLVKSTDQGRTWAEAIPVKARPNPAGWVGWSNNSVHGIQLTTGPHKGRLLIPGFLYKEGEEGQIPGVRGGVLFSDDHGSSWQVGGFLPAGSDEVTLAETSSGGVYANYRKNKPYNNAWRFHAWSNDGGENFSQQDSQPKDLPTPRCHGGLVRYASGKNGAGNTLLFSHPAGPRRSRVTVRASYDDGRTWPLAKRIDDGPSGYSDLAVTADKTILCVHEDSLDWPEDKLAAWYDSLTGYDYATSRRRWCEKISIARFNLEWLKESSAT